MLRNTAIKEYNFKIVGPKEFIALKVKQNSHFLRKNCSQLLKPKLVKPLQPADKQRSNKVELFPLDISPPTAAQLTSESLLACGLLVRF